MKKIINNSVYNTDTAKCLATWESDQDYNGLYHVDESLYRTKAGKYFVHGVGGAGSRYATTTGNNTWKPGEKIEPLTVEAASAWAQERLNAEEFLNLFGEPGEEGNDLEPLNLSMPKTTKRKLADMQSASCKSMSRIVAELIDEA